MGARKEIDEKIDEIEFRIESIIDRAQIGSDRRSLIKEFGQDLIEKARQAEIHLKKIDVNYLSFKISRILHPKNGQRQLTKTLDSYEALSTKIKGIGDNLNSFINAVYLDDKNIRTQIDKFESKPTLSRSISANQFEQIKKLFPTINGKDLEEITSEQYESFSPFFSYHRNTTQHAKTSQSLEITKKSIFIPENTINDGSKRQNIVDGLYYVLENYLDMTGSIIKTISCHNNRNIKDHLPSLNSKIANKMLLKDLRRITKRNIYTIGLAAIIIIPTYMFLTLSKNKERILSANRVITLMYETQDNKKPVNLTSLINEDNAESVNKRFSFEIRKENSTIRPEFERNYAYQDYFLKALKEDERKKYIEIVKSIRNTEEFTVDSIQRYLNAKKAIWWPAKYNPTMTAYAERMHDSLDNLVHKKLEFEKDVARNYMFDFETDKKDPILQDIKLAAAFTQLYLRRYLHTLGIYNIEKTFMDPETIVKLNEDFDGTIKSVCDKLDGGCAGVMYSLLVNNTQYLEQLSKNRHEKDDILEFVGDNVVKNIRVIGSNMSTSSTIQYKPYADIIFARLNSQRPLRSIVIPSIHETLDSTYSK